MTLPIKRILFLLTLAGETGLVKCSRRQDEGIPKVSEAHRAARRAEIIDAALRCFRRAGYQRASMADIIQESGLSAGAIYGYFPSKQALLLATAGTVLDARRIELGIDDAGRVAGRSPAAIVETVTRGLEASGLLSMVVHTWGEAAVDSDLRQVVSGMFAHVERVVRESLERWAAGSPPATSDDQGLPRDPERLVPIVLALIQGYVLRRTLSDAFDRDAYLRATASMLPS